MGDRAGRLEVVVDGTDGAGKTPCVELLCERFRRRGLEVATHAPYREREVYPLWEAAPERAARIIVEIMQRFRDTRPDADVLVWDRGWPTAFITTEDPEARALFRPLPTLTVLLLSTMARTRRRVGDRRSEGSPVQRGLPPPRGPDRHAALLPELGRHVRASRDRRRRRSRARLRAPPEDVALDSSSLGPWRAHHDEAAAQHSLDGPDHHALVLAQLAVRRLLAEHGVVASAPIDPAMRLVERWCGSIDGKGEGAASSRRLHPSFLPRGQGRMISTCPWPIWTAAVVAPSATPPT